MTRTSASRDFFINDYSFEVEPPTAFDLEEFFEDRRVDYTPEFDERARTPALQDDYVPKVHHLRMFEMGDNKRRSEIEQRFGLMGPIPLWVPCYLVQQQIDGSDGHLIETERDNGFWSKCPITVAFNSVAQQWNFDIWRPRMQFERNDRVFPTL